MSKSKKKRPYVDVSVPREWEPYLKEALENPQIQKELEIGRFTKTYGGLGVYIIHRFLLEKTSFRLEPFKYHDHATIVDNKLRRLINVYPRLIAETEFELWCEYCDSTDCEHAKFALAVPEIMKQLEERGWKYRGKK